MTPITQNTTNKPFIIFPPAHHETKHHDVSKGLEEAQEAIGLPLQGCLWIGGSRVMWVSSKVMKFTLDIDPTLSLDIKGKTVCNTMLP